MKSVFLSLALFMLASQAQAANLILKNNSAQTITLEIPGASSQILKPNSTSGVTIEKGQQIFFQHKGQRTLLLEIGGQGDGDVLVIDELISKRSEEIEKPAPGADI